MVKDREAWRTAVHGVALQRVRHGGATEQQQYKSYLPPDLVALWP